MEILPENQLPFDYFSLQMAYAYAKAGEAKKAATIWNRMITLCKENIDYGMHSNKRKGEGMDGETQQNMYYLQKIVQDAGKTKQAETEMKARKLFEDYYNRLF
jgi:pentatricopeptide repeat protein